MKIYRKDLVTNIFAAILLAIGSLQTFSHLCGLETLKGLARLTAASPLPLVFSHFRGLETFSSKFEVVASDREKPLFRIEITPELYASLGGPYNRRNVYGAAFAYGPVLFLPEERTLLDAVLRFALCRHGVLWNLVASNYDMSTVESLAIVVSPQSYIAQSEGPDVAQFTLSTGCET